VDDKKFVQMLKPAAMVVQPGAQVKLKHFDPKFTGDLKKSEAKEFLAAGIEQLAKLQAILYAQSIHALLIIFQAADAAGKDSTIKHVMSGLNPQGCQVFSFKTPSDEELGHDYLWRSCKALPERGRIGIFNRSYYEEVLVVRVHPELLGKQRLPRTVKGKHIWDQRFQEINNFEQYLVNNGILVLKFFLNVSKEEQKRRFLERIERPDKNWKLSVGDTRERIFWGNYRRAYEDAFNHTSTPWAPWHIIPADNKWFMRLAVAYFIYDKLKSLDLAYPEANEAHRQTLLEARQMLTQENEMTLKT